MTKKKKKSLVKLGKVSVF